MRICDLHTHSSNSFDAQNTVDEMCQTAIEKGLYAIAITDHCEAPMIKDGADCEFGEFDVLIPESVRDAISAKEKYRSQIKVLCGLELGEPMHDAECTKKALSYGDYDFVLASVHNLRNMQDFYYLDYNKVSVDEILSSTEDKVNNSESTDQNDTDKEKTVSFRDFSEKVKIVLTDETHDLSESEADSMNISIPKKSVTTIINEK